MWDGIWGLRNFVYQKDVSEYCRRRAVPSVFLGRRVMETNAQMLHFSKLDLPYSCFISIRTQSSNNIVMVIQLSPRSELADSCKEFGNQLIVYEFGETFGGYWGPLPANVVNSDSRTANVNKLYTLRTTQSTKTSVEETENTDGITETTTTTWRPTENDHFLTIDVPIVNLSGSLVPDELPVENSFDIDDTFDILYDVTPRKGESYETSILPLLQFSLKIQEDGRRDEHGEVRYELGYELGKFTPDYRLTLPVLSTRKILNRNRNLWKLKKAQKNRVKPRPSNAPLFTTESGMVGKSYKKELTNFRKDNVLSTRPQGHEKTEMDDESAKEKINEESLTLIEHIMKSLNKSQNIDREETEQPQNYVQAIRNISDMHHNFSAYLAPWPMYTYLPLSKATVNYTKKTSSSTLTSSGTTEAITKFSMSKFYSTQREDITKYTIVIQEELPNTKNQNNQPEKSLDDLSIKNISITSANTSTASSFTGEIQLNVSTQNEMNMTNFNSFITLGHADKFATKPLSDATKDAITFASTAMSTKSSFGSLVDHESWENVVQSAPVMAVLLNKHAPIETHNSSNVTSEAAGIDQKRRKRHIKSVPIEPARPHARSSNPTPARTLSSQVADMQDFAQLVELPDDELSSHVALRYMRQYAGPVLFNICDTHESAGYKMRHVILFNTSRIILALGNFSVSRMTVVLTSGQTLLSNEAACAQHNIECQIGGSRVCIDSTSACDGVPNCGAHDIYDEDRQQCGGAMGLQHNVVLAAVTFLAVLLTLLYIVHYWLKRCVPKVADAFFIYTDSAENVLYLDSIMRSPTDVDNVSKFMYPPSFFEENINVYEKVKEKTFLERVSIALSKFNIFKERPKSCELTEVGDLQDLNKTGMRKMYSFTEMEIRQMMIGSSKTDEEVQTTESLEIAFLKLINMYKNTAPAQAAEAKPQRQKNVLQRLELFSVESNIDEPGPSSRNVGPGYRQCTVEDERELHSTVYEPQAAGNVLSAASKNKETCPSEGTVNSKKCLRFEEQATFIVPESNQSTDADAQGQFTARHSVVLGTGLNKFIRKNINSLETIPQDPERTGTDFRSFFTGKKAKKKKNPK
ncbi:uncharacterized protein [Choristoneura fumiferana]|uniref:uncharacterized protein n=1 Tax=Choristoneura fumiferana TaxID=7141 RepID=UPI003D15B557